MLSLYRNYSFVFYIILSFLISQRFIDDNVVFRFCALLVLLPNLLITRLQTTTNAIILISTIALFRVLNVGFTGMISSGTFLYILSTLILVLIIKTLSNWALLTPWILYTVYVALRLIEVKNPELVFVNSRNYVSFYAIVLVAPYYLVNLLNNKKVIIYPAFMTLLISIAALGRSGIISSSILFLSVVASWNRNKIISFVTLTSAVIMFFGTLLGEYVSQIGFDFTDLERLQQLGDKGRENILSEIFELSITDVLFGWDPNVLPSVRKLGHMHSSWLTMASSIGFLGLMFAVSHIMLILFKYRHNPCYWSALFYFIAVSLRISTDVGLLFSPFDFIIFGTILLSRPSSLKLS